MKIGSSLHIRSDKPNIQELPVKDKPTLQAQERDQSNQAAVSLTSAAAVKIDSKPIDIDKPKPTYDSKDFKRRPVKPAKQIDPALFDEFQQKKLDPNTTGIKLESKPAPDPHLHFHSEVID